MIKTSRNSSRYQIFCPRRLIFYNNISILVRQSCASSPFFTRPMHARMQTSWVLASSYSSTPTHKFKQKSASSGEWMCIEVETNQNGKRRLSAFLFYETDKRLKQKDQPMKSDTCSIELRYFFHTSSQCQCYQCYHRKGTNQHDESTIPSSIRNTKVAYDTSIALFRLSLRYSVDDTFLWITYSKNHQVLLLVIGSSPSRWHLYDS